MVKKKSRKRNKKIAQGDYGESCATVVQDTIFANQSSRSEEFRIKLIDILNLEIKQCAEIQKAVYRGEFGGAGPHLFNRANARETLAIEVLVWAQKQ